MSSSRSCASVCNVGKTCCFKINFTTGSFLIKRGSKFDVLHLNFGPPPSFTREFLGKNGIQMPKTQGKRRFEIFGAQCRPHTMYSNSSQLEKVVFFDTGCSFSVQSILENGLIPGRHGSDNGRLSSSHHFTLLVEIPMKKDLVMIAQFFKKCTSTVIGNEIKMPCVG